MPVQIFLLHLAVCGILVTSKYIIHSLCLYEAIVHPHSPHQETEQLRQKRTAGCPIQQTHSATPHQD